MGVLRKQKRNPKMHHQLVSGEREKINNKINRVLAIRRVGGGLEKFSLISQIECVYGLVVHVKPSRWTSVKVVETTKGDIKTLRVFIDLVRNTFTIVQSPQHKVYLTTCASSKVRNCIGRTSHATCICLA